MSMKADLKKLSLEFRDFRFTGDGDVPEDVSFCLLVMNDDTLTCGEWWPGTDDGRKGSFIRGTADSVKLEDVKAWLPLKDWNLREALDDNELELSLVGENEDFVIELDGFHPMKKNDLPEDEQYCLLILKDGNISGGRWEDGGAYLKEPGFFNHAPAASIIDYKRVAAWAPLDPFKHDPNENVDPVMDAKKFRYGLDIETYYEKALEKLKEKYSWAEMKHLKKDDLFVIEPIKGRYEFALHHYVDYTGKTDVQVWSSGKTSEEFIDFLAGRSEPEVQNANEEEKFRYGYDIDVYVDKAFEILKKTYWWADRSNADKKCRFTIEERDGQHEFVEYRGKKDKGTVVDGCQTSDLFVSYLVSHYDDDVRAANKEVARYDVDYAPRELFGGWNLERYIFYKLRTGDYKVFVQAGDRASGASREFYIPPEFFKEKTYDGFLDRYIELVPGDSFGLFKEDLIKDEGLREFLGY